MKKIEKKNMLKQKKIFVYNGGKIFYSKKAERKFYFILTMIMLLLGVLAMLDFF